MLEPGGDDLIDAVAAANSRTVVVLETGNPVLMPWRDRTAAILQAWYPGQRGGEAIARVLSGAVNPSGRLPVTFPAATGQLPHPALPGSDVPAPPKGGSIIESLNDKVPFSFSYREGADVGYRWYFKTGANPLYPFGHGLSYTSFRYSGLRAGRTNPLEATFTVTNSGAVAGTDVPQVYVAPPGGVKRLVGWARPTLEAGQQTRVTVKADMRTLADYDPKTRRWVLPAGTYRLEVGSSALATQLRAEVVISRTVLQTPSK